MEAVKTIVFTKDGNNYPNPSQEFDDPEILFTIKSRKNLVAIIIDNDTYMAIFKQILQESELVLIIGDEVHNIDKEMNFFTNQDIKAINDYCNGMAISEELLVKINVVYGIIDLCHTKLTE